MRENGIVVERKRKFKATTDSDQTFNIAPNLLEHDFTADQPNQKWAGDNSYIWTREGWLYLAAILDLHSRRVIGGAAFSIATVAANTVRTITRTFCVSMDCECP